VWGSSLTRMREGSIRADGFPIIVVEQTVEVARPHADRGYVLDSGPAILHATSAELLQTTAVKRIFLGDVALQW
jgi:ABC-type branched-subunit amino acid transport system ATPase component